ncbi:MAG: hypothetical protein H0W02_06660 [Ktedonobacteraceae bacterium]|nr:hypothetical protein [Ktedonobacteraceae bacterium]MDQ2907485.1 hypothetical protein [Chloroflexota bacterium]
MFRSFIGKTIMAIFLVGGLVGLFLSLSYYANASQAVPHTPPSAKPTNRGVGFPAITPHLNLALSQASKPTFTQADVAFYVGHHGSPVGPLVPGAHLTIPKIQFTTANQASQIMAGESIGIPGNAPVCYVLLQGPFQATNVRLSPALASKLHGTPVVSRTELVFDGRTGNLLVWGIPAGN